MHERAEDILDRLPHRPPFRFLTDSIVFGEGPSARGVWRVAGDESFFAGHFPGAPIVPGVLIGEALAQLSGLVASQAGGSVSSGAGASPAASGKLAHIELRFSSPVAPPAEILLTSKFERSLGALWQFEVEAMIGDVSVARGGLTLALDLGDERSGGDRR